MSHMKTRIRWFALLAVMLIGIGVAAYPSVCHAEARFVPLFDGKDLNGWVYVGQAPGYEVRDGIIICPAGCSGNLFTEKEYSDFVLDVDFRLSANALLYREMRPIWAWKSRFSMIVVPCISTCSLGSIVVPFTTLCRRRKGR